MPIFGWIEPEVVAIFIPIIGVLGGVLIAVTAVVVGGRRKELEHRERIIAMEKGLPVPGPMVEPERPKYAGRRANGLVMTGIGLALTIALSAEEGFADGGVWGLIPLFIGVGLLVAGSLDKREWETQQRKNNSTPM
ncbi:MAG TPA: DUF6249 domain-containing protein [Candidatus Krumholzibacteria bacterium]|nr:DUF6249 domain-containing protein [Candidatus Krumholzibacteria bacterium]